MQDAQAGAYSKIIHSSCLAPASRVILFFLSSSRVQCKTQGHNAIHITRVEGVHIPTYLLS